ncbi:UNKNOWN [Stylonychia lemnae]|uniref:Uncharacterized protein n=1 Tax=Stylonychia lemnae TaxID=5949 RepID=A0A078ASL3_STYLE|nr:UNKNOWN [Stylonychia lemnae]|eukprot:CDW84197.1 UNKNOWN [Stylonychia lemnae]
MEYNLNNNETYGTMVETYHPMKSFDENFQAVSADTVVMALLYCQNHLPPTATVEDCIRKYQELKIQEIEEIGKLFETKYKEQLNQIEQFILGEQPKSPTNTKERCYRRLCIWGKKTPIEYQKPYEGGPTPLLKSPQRRFYVVFTVINLLLFIVLFVMYIVQFRVQADSTPDCVRLDSIYIQVIVFAGVNTIWYVQLARIDYLSDQEWSKFMTFTAIDILAQLVSVIVTMYFTVVRYNDAHDQDCFDQNLALFVQIFVVIGFNAIILVIQTIAIITLTIQLFGHPQKFFYFREEKDVKIRM